MRTTVTLDPDTEAVVRRLMKERGVGFKQAVNDAIRGGAIGISEPPFRTRTFSMGAPLVPLTRAHQLAGALEDEETARKLAMRK